MLFDPTLFSCCKQHAIAQRSRDKRVFYCPSRSKPLRPRSERLGPNSVTYQGNAFLSLKQRTSEILLYNAVTTIQRCCDNQTMLRNLLLGGISTVTDIPFAMYLSTPRHYASDPSNVAFLGAHVSGSVVKLVLLTRAHSPRTPPRSAPRAGAATAPAPQRRCFRWRRGC